MTSGSAPRPAVALVLGAVLMTGCSPTPEDVQGASASGPRQARSAQPDDPHPSDGSTGPPAGVTLRPYDGPCLIDEDGALIEASIITCDRLVVLGDDVTVRASVIHGRIDLDHEGAHLTLEDSEIDAGNATAPAVGFVNLTIRRSEIRGGQTSVQCAANCTIEDSLLHEQMLPVGDQHLGGYLSNGGSDVVVRHNTIACTSPDNDEGGGCTGSVQIFGDVAELSDFRFEDNLIRATPGGYCASFGHNPGKPFGELPQNIVVVGNVFERGPSGRCGVWGAATSFLGDGPGNVWENNVWDDGSAVVPNE